MLKVAVIRAGPAWAGDFTCVSPVVLLPSPCPSYFADTQLSSCSLILLTHVRGCLAPRLDYNHEANHWGLYANNRISQAQPQYAPLLAFLPKARAQAAFYTCSGGGSGGCCPDGAVRCGNAPLCNSSSSSPCPGLHFPGHIAPFGYDATLAGEPWASMSDHSNGVFASLNMIQEWEYSRNTTFLRTVAFPFCRDTLLFYQSWMRRRADGSWVNENDQANECTSDGTLAGVFDSCYQNNTVFSNGFARRVASALPSMAKHLGEPVDPQWEEIALQLDPLPTILTNGTSALPFEPPRQVIILAGNYTDITSTTGAPACKVTCGTRACGRSCPAQVAGDGMIDVMVPPPRTVTVSSLATPIPHIALCVRRPGLSGRPRRSPLPPPRASSKQCGTPYSSQRSGGRVIRSARSSRRRCACACR